MATLQKIRSNKVTQAAIGLGMLAFIAGGVVEIMKKSGPDTEVSSLNGESLDYAELNDMVDEYKEVLQTMGQLPEGEQVSNEVMAQIREQVYQRYLQQKMLEAECAKVGLTVTDAELQDIIKKGNNPLLGQTPFCSQQGVFDYATLQQFLKQRQDMLSNPQVSPEQREYIERYYRLWCFIENEVRKNTLMQKYQMLLSGLTMSNPVSAKASFDGRTNETDILLAALPYTSIEDKDIKVEDADLKAKYEEYKEPFYQFGEIRDIKYIDVVIKASKADEEALNKEMAEYAESLQKDDAVIEAIVRQSQSNVPYAGLPITTKALPYDIAARVDSMAVGTQTEPYYNIADNSVNIVKLMSKVSLPDSIEVRQIAAVNADLAAAKKSADSICNALQAGANFDTIAKAYNQPATKQWIVSQMYEGGSVNDNTKKMITTINAASTGSINQVEVDGGILVVQVTDRRNMVNKYDVAVIKRTIDFSNATANDYYNNLSSFVATNKTLADLEKNQTAEYALLSRNDIDPMAQALPGIEDSREVIRWAYKENTQVNDISEINYCGKSREHLVVAVLTGIHTEGYRDMNDEQIKRYLTDEVIKDKKAAKLQEKMNGAKSIADVAKIAGAVEDTIQHITFAAPAYLQKMGAVSEAAISGAASAAAQGKFVSGIKGNAGVYAFQVLSKNKTEEKYDEKAEMQRIAQQNAYMMMSMTQSDLRNPSNIFYNAYKKAKRTDKRQLFY